MPEALALLVAALGATTNIATNHGDDVVPWAIAAALAVTVAGLTVVWERSRPHPDGAPANEPLERVLSNAEAAVALVREIDTRYSDLLQRYATKSR